MQNELALEISKQFNLPAAATSETFRVLSYKDNTAKRSHLKIQYVWIERLPSFDDEPPEI